MGVRASSALSLLLEEGGAMAVVEGALKSIPRPPKTLSASLWRSGWILIGG